MLLIIKTKFYTRKLNDIILCCRFCRSCNTLPGSVNGRRMENTLFQSIRLYQHVVFMRFSCDECAPCEARSIRWTDFCMTIKIGTDLTKAPTGCTVASRLHAFCSEPMLDLFSLYPLMSGELLSDMQLDTRRCYGD